MEEIELFGKGKRVCFARVQTSQILFDSKEKFNKVLAMKSNLDGDGCPSRRCHKVVEVFKEGGDLVTWVVSDGMGVTYLMSLQPSNRVHLVVYPNQLPFSSSNPVKYTQKEKKLLSNLNIS